MILVQGVGVEPHPHRFQPQNLSTLAVRPLPSRLPSRIQMEIVGRLIEGL